ncbi:MAG: hypothetical protein JNK27_11915 [Chitinophagaceae bacterium]|nr:hypothetical protein [Chitinophagaceae bacterium]
MWFINLIYWFHVFLSPVLLLGLIGLWIGSEKMLFLLLAIGGVIGIVLAEYIRRKIGLSIFFSRIYGPNEMDEKF